MKKHRLTEDFVASLEVNGKDRIVFDAHPGFGIRITPSGTKIFIAQGRARGRKRRVTVGFYPDMSVTEAREEALHVLADMRAGEDPVVERKIRQAAAAAKDLTIAQLGEKWLTDYVRPKLKPRTQDDYERLLAQHINPAVGRLPVAHISRDDVVGLHVSMKHIPRRANYTISTLRALINFGIDLGYRPPASNPVRRIKMYRQRLHERFLTEAEIAKAADAITQAEQSGKVGPHGAAGLRLCLFTGARSGEITAVEWSHVDQERRLIRLPDSKTNEPRTIHLSPAALEVLDGIPRVGRYVIAGAKADEPYKNLKRAWIIARAYAGLDDVRLHDLRHSYASWAINRGISLEMIGKLLGHKVAATTQRYAHLARDVLGTINDDLGAAMQAAIEKKQPPSGKVIRLKRRK
jgi:integrase